jgi:hypothetical protein
MHRSGIVILTIALAGLIVMIGIALRLNRPPERQALSRPEPLASQPTASVRAPRPIRPTQPEQEAPASTLKLDDQGLPVVPRDKVDEYVRSQKRSRSSLIAAYRALGDTNYLREAATNFPNDPELQWTILASRSFPEERRKWLDAFKASSPDNSIADYFSAQDHLKNGQPDLAMAELTAATAKAQFKDYRVEAQLEGEELGASMGHAGKEQFTLGMAGLAVLPDLSDFRGLVRDMVALQQQQLAAGNSDSAITLTQMSLSLAERFQSGEGSKYFMNQVAGMAMEADVLQSLDQNTSYEVLGGRTPAQAQAERKQRREELVGLTKAIGGAFIDMSDVSSAEFNNYAQRLKIYGELEAARWLREQHKAP